jgi:hypothetical protein
MAEPSLFEDAAAVLPSMIPESFGPLRVEPRRWGLKAWFGPPGRPPKVHYEAQLVGKRDLPGLEVQRLALEIGWHSEQPKESDNEAQLAVLVAGERAWRKVIGGEAECGVFFGRARNWRRVSEAWPDPDLDDPALGFEVAARLTDYVVGLEPVVRKRR